MTEISVGIYEAKTQLSKLIEGVNKGTQVTITQRGRPVASLIPYQKTEEGISNRYAAIKNIRRFRAQQKPVHDFEQLLKADQK